MTSALPVLRVPAAPLAAGLRPAREALRTVLLSLQGLLQEMAKTGSEQGNALVATNTSDAVSAKPRRIERPRQAVD